MGRYVLKTFDLPQTDVANNKFGDTIVLKVTQAVMFGINTPGTNTFPPPGGIPSECAVVAIMIVCIQSDLK
jgi:hypothetical protein